MAKPTQDERQQTQGKDRAANSGTSDGQGRSQGTQPGTQAHGGSQQSGRDKDRAGRDAGGRNQNAGGGTPAKSARDEKGRPEADKEGEADMMDDEVGYQKKGAREETKANPNKAW